MDEKKLQEVKTEQETTQEALDELSANKGGDDNE